MKFLKTKEVAEMLNVSTQTVRNMVRTDKLIAIKFGSQWRFRESDIVDYIEKGTK